MCCCLLPVYEAFLPALLRLPSEQSLVGSSSSFLPCAVGPAKSVRGLRVRAPGQPEHRRPPTAHAARGGSPSPVGRPTHLAGWLEPTHRHCYGLLCSFGRSGSHVKVAAILLLVTSLSPFRIVSQPEAAGEEREYVLGWPEAASRRVGGLSARKSSPSFLQIRGGGYSSLALSIMVGVRLVGGKGGVHATYVQYILC